MRALSWDDFAGTEGATWQVSGEDQPSVEMTLEQVVALPPSVRPEGSFRLEFRGPFEPVLPQAIYQFRCGDECHEIFIVPVARDDRGARYEAVFN
jgi:hypothetical protein